MLPLTLGAARYLNEPSTSHGKAQHASRNAAKGALALQVALVHAEKGKERPASTFGLERNAPRGGFRHSDVDVS